MARSLGLAVALVSVLTTLALLAADKDGATDAAKADSDFAFQGEYAGMVKADDGDKKSACRSSRWAKESSR